jgi:hypothetical protein
MNTQPLLERLRQYDDVEMGGVCEVTVLRNPDGPEAADRIEALIAQVEMLEGALRFQPVPSETSSYQADGYAAGWQEAIAQFKANARKALSSKSGSVGL